MLWWYGSMITLINGWKSISRTSVGGIIATAKSGATQTWWPSGSCSPTDGWACSSSCSSSSGLSSLLNGCSIASSGAGSEGGGVSWTTCCRGEAGCYSTSSWLIRCTQTWLRARWSRLVSCSWLVSCSRLVSCSWLVPCPWLVSCSWLVACAWLISWSCACLVCGSWSWYSFAARETCCSCSSCGSARSGGSCCAGLVSWGCGCGSSYTRCSTTYTWSTAVSTLIHSWSGHWWRTSSWGWLVCLTGCTAWMTRLSKLACAWLKLRIN